MTGRMCAIAYARCRLGQALQLGEFGKEPLGAVGVKGDFEELTVGLLLGDGDDGACSKLGAFNADTRCKSDTAGLGRNLGQEIHQTRYVYVHQVRDGSEMFP